MLYRGTVDCIQQVLRKDGLRGFYAAALPSYLKVRYSTTQHMTVACVIPDAVLQPN